MSDFLQTLRSGTVLLMDGAMGTELQRLPNATICQIHSTYTAAAADVILTNTFQAHSRGDLHDSWQSAIRAARQAHPKPRFILGDVGPVAQPTSKFAASIFAECETLDGVLLETWTSLDALKVFAQARPAPLPMLVSFTFMHDGLQTFESATPQTCARAAQQCGAVAVGANCGKDIDMDDMRQIVERYRAACELPILVRPNAGTPLHTRAGWNYPRTPAALANGVHALLEAGATMIGGCCGTTPAHIGAIHAVVDQWNQAPLSPARQRRPGTGSSAG